MKLEKIQEHWEKLGKVDPLWAVMSLESKKGNKWNVKDFFQTGAKEIDGVMKYIKKLNFNLKKGKALDFGCGVGRLTQALAKHFKLVVGVDIALSMIELAKKYNRFGKRVKYFVNKTNSLSRFKSSEFDFIYSSITLQHMKTKYAKEYLKEFLRILSPGGLLVFQLPSRPLGLQNLRRIIPMPLLYFYFWLKKQPTMEMHWLPRTKVENFLKELGAKILAVERDYVATGNQWESYKYFVTK